MNGQTRLHVGQAHELEVAKQLERRGWAVKPWGQGLFDDNIRQALINRKDPVVYWRWIPDLIAVRGETVYLVDPKTDMRTDTPNFSIELDAFIAHNAMRALGLHIVYVWADLTCNTPGRLVSAGLFTPEPGRNRVATTNGSGTSFMLVRKDAQMPFDKVFGPPNQSSPT